MNKTNLDWIIKQSKLKGDDVGVLLTDYLSYQAKVYREEIKYCNARPIFVNETIENQAFKEFKIMYEGRK